MICIGKTKCTSEKGLLGNSLQYIHMNEKEIPGALLIFPANARSLNPNLKQTVIFYFLSFFRAGEDIVGRHLESGSKEFSI